MKRFNKILQLRRHTKLKRFSRSATSVVLAVCLLISCMTVGLIATDAAKVTGEKVGALSVAGKIYFIKPSDWTYVALGIGHSSYSDFYQMSNISGTSLYYINRSSSWSDSTEFAFFDVSGWGGESHSLSYRSAWATHSSTINSSYALNAGSTYLITTTSNSPTYYSGGYSALNNTLTIKTALKNGSTYDDTSTKLGTFSASNAKKMSADGTSANSSVSQTNGSGTLSVARTNTATITQSAVSGYTFKGWKAGSLDSSGTGLSSTYSFTNSGSNQTVYAYYEKTTYNISFSQPSNGSIKINNSTSSPVAIEHGNSVSIVVTPNTGYKIKTLTDNDSAVSAAVGSTSAYTYTISSVTAAHTIAATMEAAHTQLSAPTNVKLNNNASDLTVDAQKDGKVTLSWSAVSNAGSYKIYKDGGSTPVTTVTAATSYQIEKGYSYGGTYTVVAVPSNTNTYSESPASTGRKLTVNKVQLNAPTVSQSASEVVKGSTVEFTLTNTNSSYTSGTDYKYQHSGENNSTYADVTNLSWTTSALNTTGTRTFKFKATALLTDYYTDSSEESKTVTVCAEHVYCLTGDMVTGQGGSDGWPTEITTYPVDTFVSNNVFYRTVTISGGGSNDKHYFRLTNQSNQYTVTSGQDTDMAEHNSSSSAVTASTTGTNGAMYVTGNGNFKVYVDQSTSGQPKAWVISNEWSLTTTSYFQSYNLQTDSYNEAEQGNTGGTASPGSVEVLKGSSTTLSATAASGYSFAGWYNDPDFDDGHRVSTSANYTFTPNANGDYYALFKQNTPAHYNVTAVNSDGNANVSVTYNGTTITAGSGTLSVPVGASVTYSISAKTGCQINSRTPSSLITSNSGSFTMPASATAVTVTASKINYTLTGVISPNYGTLKFYSNSACTTEITTAQYNQTFYAKYTEENGYVLKNFSISGTGATITSTNGNVATCKMGSANVTVTANVMLQYAVTYYVDMHDNSMSGKTVSVAIYSQGWSSILKDGNGNNCSATLTQQGSSTVYAADINTPLTQSGGSYSDLYAKVTYTGKGSYNINISGDKVATLASTHEMWLEAENEASAKLTVNYSTRSTPTVATGNRRIYLAKPYGWQTSEPSWENIGIYHWGDYTDIGWNSGIKMHYLGNSGSDGYHYYYVDIPKAIDGNKVNNLIFQGWGSNQSAGTYSKAQTGNIENIPDSANFFILSKDGSAYVGTKSEEDAVIPNYTRYVSSVTMNKTETTAVNIKPTFTGESISFTSNGTGVVTVDSNGNITPVGRGTTTITVQIYGTIGSLVTTEDNDHKDYLTYTVSVTVKDPTQFNGFEIMSLESKTYTVDVPTVSGDQPGYFDMSQAVMTVEGVHGVTSSTNSAIITQTATASVSGVGTVCTAFTVKYAKANSDFTNYSNISVTGKVVTKSIEHTTSGKRYGLDHWERKLSSNGTTASPNPTYSIATSVSGSVETATTSDILFETTYSTYSAKFAEYNYVDVTFTFSYYEYKPKKVDADGNVVADNADGMIQYPYDSDWADESNNNYNYANSHTLKTITVEDYEVRGKTASNVAASDLVTPAVQALEEMPSNNYYSYMIDADSISISNRDDSNYTADATVNMKSQVQLYSVYVNGTEFTRNNQDGRTKYYYQEYAEPTVENASNWYAVDERTATDTSNAPLLATNVNSYKFRVKGSANSNNTYLRTAAATNAHGNEFIRSEVDFSHNEITHREKTVNNTTTTVEYLLQNFYIADFFSPSKVLDPNSNNGQGNLPYDDAQFVGGGVVYYSVTNRTPFANAVSAGYVDGNGIANATAVKEMLKANIEAQYNVDNIAGTVGEEEAMKIAYGTEIAAKKNVEGGFNTGIIYRYLPLNQYNRNDNGVLIPDSEGKYTYNVNSNTFRYSNSLQSYQYVYASGNENKATNSGKNMRLYSYYVYSYVAYNQETNVPETRYEVVLSDNYADASTYWEGNPNPNPNS